MILSGVPQLSTTAAGQDRPSFRDPALYSSIVPSNHTLQAEDANNSTSRSNEL